MNHEQLRELFRFMSAAERSSYGLSRSEAESLLAEHDSLRAENERLRELVRQAMDSQGPLSAAKWLANARELLGRE